MAGPGGAEVGRVHIRVVPDFTHFRREMLEELKKWDGREVTIKVNADVANLKHLTKDMTKAARESSKEVSKEVSKGLKKASKGAVISPKLDHKTRYKRRIEADINKLFGDVEVRLKYQTGDNIELRKTFDKQEQAIREYVNKINDEMGDFDFQAQARTIDKLLEKSKLLAKTRLISPDAKLDYDLMEKSVGKIDEAAQSAREHNRVMREWSETFKQFNTRVSESYHGVSDLDRAFDSWSKKDTRVQLRELVYGFKDLDGTLHRTTSYADRFRMSGGLLGAIFGGTAALGTLDAAKRGLTGLAQVGGKLADMAEGFSPRDIGLSVGLVPFIAMVTLGVMSLAPVIGLVSAALLTLPGILATITAPIAATILGFNGIKKAAENAGLFGDKNGAKKGGGSLGKALEELKKNTEGVFERTLTEPFKKIGEAANALVAPMQTVAQGVADVMSDIINTITSEANVSRIAETFKSIGLQLTNSFGPGLADFTDGLLGLAAEFTKPGGALEGLGAWFKDTMGDFKNWVEQGIKSGELTELFNELGESLRVVLELAGELALKGIEFVSDPAKMQGFKDSLKEIADLLNMIMDVSVKMAPFFKVFAGGLDFMTKPFQSLMTLSDNLKEPLAWVDFFKNSIPGGSLIPDLFKPKPGEIAKVAEDSARQLAEATRETLSRNQEMFAVQPWALGADNLNNQVANQLTTQATDAINAARQALVPLQEGLQADINNALTPLGDIAGRIAAAFGDVPDLVTGALSQVPGIVTTQLSGVKGAAETSMAGLNDAVVAACALALQTAETQAPAIVQPFRDLKGSMESVGADIMGGLAIGIRNNAGLAKEAASVAAAEVLQAARDAVHSKSPSRDFMDLGKDINAGLAIGIDNSTNGPLSAIREVMQAIKDVFGSAEGINLNFFLGQAATSMSTLADTSREFRTNMTEAVTAPQVSSDLANVDMNDIKRQKAEIDLRLAELTAQKNATQDKVAKAALQGEMDQLRIQKERLDLLKEENGLQEKRQTAIQKLSDTIATSIVDTIMMPGEFAKATTNAAMQDLGISGTGALPTIANWALDAGTNFIFNVNNMDDAIQGQQAQQRKQTAGIAGR